MRDKCCTTNHESSESATLLPATQYHYGPLIESPPSHIDTVLTSMTYNGEFLKNFGIKQICRTADMQLYELAMKIMWSDPKRGYNFAMRPGAMHTLSSCLGSIVTIMKGLGLEEHLQAYQIL